MEETNNLIEEQFKRLPESFQNALKAVPWKSSIKEISLLSSIPIEKIEAVTQETLLVLYGFEKPEDYILNLVTEAGIDKKSAIEIAERASVKIFEEISKKAGGLQAQDSGATSLQIPSKESSPIGARKAKKFMIEELSQRVERAKQNNSTPISRVLEGSHDIHPMLEEGEVAHAVPLMKEEEKTAPTPQAEAPAAQQTPIEIPVRPTNQPPQPIETPAIPAGHKYPGGIDPYREPLI